METIASALPLWARAAEVPEGESGSVGVERAMAPVEGTTTVHVHVAIVDIPFDDPE
jgi:hypothetical protein